MRYLHQDHLGSTSVITADTDRLYTGQRFDAATGLYYYNARYYDPTLARFISPDTIVPGVGDPQAWNRYAYVLGNPLRYTDPSGHCEARSPNGNVLQTNNTWDCTFSEIQALGNDIGAMGLWVEMLRQRDGSVEAYAKNAGADLVNVLAMNGYDGLLAMMGLIGASGCSVNSPTNLDCSPLKPTPKENVLVKHAIEKVQQAVTRECGTAIAAVVGDLTTMTGFWLASTGVGVAPGAALIITGLVINTTAGTISATWSANDGNGGSAAVGFGSLAYPPLPGAAGGPGAFAGGVSAVMTCF
jgi:RHS repeat-associated protein